MGKDIVSIFELILKLTDFRGVNVKPFTRQASADDNLKKDMS